MTTPVDLRDAYAACERLATSHYENFPVASRLVPSRMRPHVAAIYAFARRADDFADEGTLDPSDRHLRLDAWQEALHAAVDGRRVDTADAPLFHAVAHTIHTHALPVGLFDDLLSAFHQDVDVSRYERWDDVMDYCRRSANPVGRLVLRLAGVVDDDSDRDSDAVCTALQLANFWQDFSVDWSRGRLYVPLEIVRREGADERALEAGRFDAAWRRVAEVVVRETRRLFDRGRPVCGAVTGRLAWELRATWLGGTAILDKIERAHFDVWSTRPTVGLVDAPRLVWRLLTWRAATAPRVD
ncbi:MAG: squalene synthase HpnC [Vicinamibacterales bacterium]